jgi:hypothetical protein
MMSPDPADDETPFADPAIRIEYEAALGQFILAYNEVDYRLSQVIRAELSKRGSKNLAGTAAKGFLTQRLEALELLATSSKNLMLSPSSITRLRTLNTDRNNLAHGHFDQNPFDGSYWIVLKAKAADYPVERIHALTSELTQIAGELRTNELIYDFEDLTDRSV